MAETITRSEILEGQIRDVLSLACETLGFSREKFETLTGYSFNRPSITECMILCELFHIELEALASGYDQNEHLFKIVEALNEGLFVLPLSRKMKQILFLYLSCSNDPYKAGTITPQFVESYAPKNKVRLNAGYARGNRREIEKKVIPKVLARFALPLNSSQERNNEYPVSGRL